MDATEKRLTLAYTRALEQVHHITRNDGPGLARAVVKANQALNRLRRYQASRN